MRTGNCLAKSAGLICCFIGTFEFMVAFLSFWDRPVRARSFYPKERISIFEGLEKVKAGIGRYLRSIFVFKFGDGLLFSSLRKDRRGLAGIPIPPGSRNIVTMSVKPSDF